ncbi:ABC transporter ATP-binding protein [Amycolatopsis thermoflava]|uniref:ABC transporter ATP-binding protein n=1 Tax=Amycolatopsis thermoflava TaxID=84480 RepID=UPI003EBE0F80
MTVRITALTRRFDDRTVLDGLDLTIGEGEFVALLGRSGSGKSTLLRVLAGLDSGTESAELTLPAEVAAAFQEPRLLPWQRVWRNVVLGLDVPHRKQLAERALAEVGLAGHARAWPLTLSGGEAQRVSLARALVREPKLLLLDEPFGALDALTRVAMHDLVAGLWGRHRPSVLLVTHDVDEAIKLADRVLVLSAGRITHSAVVDVGRPRAADHHRVAALRTELLAELGALEPAH